MAKITIVGDAIVITSAQKLEDIKMLEQYRPKALCLYETAVGGKKEEIFKLGTTDGAGSISQYGASFGSTTHDGEKLATITMSLPRNVDDVKQYAADIVGVAILSLNKVEEQFAGALAEVASEKASVMENITIAQ